MPYDPLLSKSTKFEFPNQYDVDQMDLIDLRRKIMKWCAKSQGAIGPCRECVQKCNAGIRALKLYDGIDATKASEPEVNNPFVRKNKEVPVKIKEEVVKMNKGKKETERPVSKWYEDAVASGDPVKWCMDNLNLPEQKAKKRVYMYEYNRFGMRRHKDDTKPSKEVKVAVGPVVKVMPEPVVKVAPEPVAKIADDTSLITAMETEMKTLTAKKQEYRTKIDEMTNEYKKISDRLEAITMCVEQYRSTV